jgi:two-component system CAI-1 autoinducer sensor kinase/phosphatase CqsS
VKLVCFEEKEDFQFHGSSTLLIMIFFNLFKNALYSIRLAGKGNIKISTILTPKFNNLCFTDTGTGIENDALPQVFDPFFTTKESGGGIGLAFCRRVMISFGGNIRCESIPGKFTTFTLEFPILKNSGGLAIIPASGQVEATNVMFSPSDT